MLSSLLLSKSNSLILAGLLVPLLRRQLGIVFQDFNLLSDRNVEENLRFVLKATGWKDASEIRKRINEVLDQVDLRAKARKFPHELSGGEQQRVVIARALLNRPDIILADEPTGNLDSRTEGDVFNLFCSLVDQGKTMLMVTHNKELSSQVPRTIEIMNGLITRDETNQTVLEQASLAASQFVTK